MTQKTKPKSKSAIFEAVHETASDLHRLRFINKRNMQNFDARCLAAPANANMYELLQVVRSTVSLPAAWGYEAVSVGDIGTIVHVFQSPQLAYMVEFSDESGETLACPIFLPHQIEPYTNGEQII